MATWTFDEHREGDRASTDVKAGQTLNRVWDVATDTYGLTSAHAIAALFALSGVGKGSPHPDYPWATCTKIDAERNPDHPHLFTVTAYYQEPAPAPGQSVPSSPGGANPKPEDRPPSISGDFRRVDEYRTTDRKGKLYANTAGDLFETPLPTPKTEGVIRVKRWYADISYVQLMGYHGKYNADEWHGFPRGSLLILADPWTPKSERGWDGWEVNWELNHKPLPTGKGQVKAGQVGAYEFTPVLNVGWNVMELVDGELVKMSAKDVFGEKLASPVKLAADGTALPEGADPVYLFFEEFEPISFALIG